MVTPLLQDVKGVGQVRHVDRRGPMHWISCQQHSSPQKGRGCWGRRPGRPCKSCARHGGTQCLSALGQRRRGKWLILLLDAESCGRPAWFEGITRHDILKYTKCISQYIDVERGVDWDVNTGCNFYLSFLKENPWCLATGIWLIIWEPRGWGCLCHKHIGSQERGDSILKRIGWMLAYGCI